MYYNRSLSNEVHHLCKRLVIESPMLHARFEDHQTFGSEKKRKKILMFLIFNVLPYMKIGTGHVS